MASMAISSISMASSSNIISGIAALNIIAFAAKSPTSSPPPPPHPATVAEVTTAAPAPTSAACSAASEGLRGSGGGLSAKSRRP
eukprot:2840097-Pyramimonas_sp.AAC.1